LAGPYSHGGRRGAVRYLKVTDQRVGSQYCSACADERLKDSVGGCRMGADSGRKDGPVRLKDIAKDLGGSVVTVSKVLRNHDDISAAMKARVRERMRQLNYQPNWIARSLATQRTYIIGLVIPDLSHTFFSEIAKVIGRAVRSQGYEVLISYSEEVPRIEREAIDRLL